MHVKERPLRFFHGGCHKSRRMKGLIRVRKTKVLFVCGQNTARSQMAEAILKELGGDAFEVESAGLEAGPGINPLAVEVMKEIGLDISNNEVTKVFDLFVAGRTYHYVISVCDAAKAQRCPVFPGICERRHWPFDDPASFEGSWEERVAATRRVRDQIREAVEALIAEVKAAQSGSSR